MNFRLIAISLSLTLLVACGGGGGNSTASSGNNRVATPIETLSVGSRTITIGGDNGVAPLSGLNSFTPSITSPTMQAVREIGADSEFYFTAQGYGQLGKIGDCCGGVPGEALPGDPQDHSHFDKQFRSSDPEYNNWLFIRDLSQIHPTAVSCRHSGCEGKQIEDYFVDSSYRSRTSSIATIGDISFARGSLTAIRRHDNTPLEFQTFAGWFDNRIFATMRISIGEPGREQYRLHSYYGHHADYCCGGGTAPTGTGSARWAGAAVASIKDAAAIEDDWSFIRGDATIEMDDLSTPYVDLRFDNWHLINGREVSLPATIFEGAEICLPCNAGHFSLRDTSGAVSGTFHGDNQSEVGGIFETETLAGAYAGVRQ